MKPFGDNLVFSINNSFSGVLWRKNGVWRRPSQNLFSKIAILRPKMDFIPKKQLKQLIRDPRTRTTPSLDHQFSDCNSSGPNGPRIPASSAEGVPVFVNSPCLWIFVISESNIWPRFNLKGVLFKNIFPKNHEISNEKMMKNLENQSEKSGFLNREIT